jgi:hypothetical protein
MEECLDVVDVLCGREVRNTEVEAKPFGKREGRVTEERLVFFLDK